jgi:hypothetical protein
MTTYTLDPNQFGAIMLAGGLIVGLLVVIAISAWGRR